VLRLGLCCLFLAQPIRFRTTTAKSLSGLRARERTKKLRAIAAHNAMSLRDAIAYCAAVGIGCFRVNSQILPLKTHPQLGYRSDLLGEAIIAAFRACGTSAVQTGVRLCFHPDQFIVLSSPDHGVVANSLAELEYQAEVAEWIGADVINVHAGGAYGAKSAALTRFADSVRHLSRRARTRLTVENDDRVYTPRDLLPTCEDLGLPFVYDAHHHRCHGDSLDLETTTQLALRTWDREPLFHISSPRDGWRTDNPRPHHDYISLRDFPRCWDNMHITVEVEAKAKELAVLRLANALKRRARRTERL